MFIFRLKRNFVDEIQNYGLIPNNVHLLLINSAVKSVVWRRNPFSCLSTAVDQVPTSGYALKMCNESNLFSIHYTFATLDGGTYINAELSPDFLLTQDCIFVDLAFRVEMFGWLNLGCGEYTGNMALKDQQLGIKWVYDNIENFSGNKKQILLFGHSDGKFELPKLKFGFWKAWSIVCSTGGAYANVQMLNKKSRSFFTRSFAASGTSLNYYGYRKNNHLQQIQKCLNIYDVNKLVDYLKVAQPSDLFKCNVLDFTGIPTWTTTLECANVPDAFLTKTPDEIYNSNDAPQKDAMFSIVDQVHHAWIILSEFFVFKNTFFAVFLGSNTSGSVFAYVNTTNHSSRFRSSQHRSTIHRFYQASLPKSKH